MVWNWFGLQRKNFLRLFLNVLQNRLYEKLTCFVLRISLADNIKKTPICTYIWFFFSAVWLFFCMSVLYFLKARRVMLEPKGSLIVRRLAPNAVLARQLPNQWTWLDESIVQFFITHLKLCEKWEKSLPASNIAQWDEIWRKSIAYVICWDF